jgi:hypothetical protein
VVYCSAPAYSERKELSCAQCLLCNTLRIDVIDINQGNGLLALSGVRTRYCEKDGIFQAATR